MFIYIIANLFILSITFIAVSFIWSDYAKNKHTLSPYPFIAFIIAIGMLGSTIFYSMGSNRNFKNGYDDGYKQGQVDYMNGNIQYKAVPTTQYERLEK